MFRAWSRLCLYSASHRAVEGASAAAAAVARAARVDARECAAAAVRGKAEARERAAEASVARTELEQRAEDAEAALRLQQRQHAGWLVRVYVWRSAFFVCVLQQSWVRNV